MPWNIRFPCCRDDGEGVVARNRPVEPKAVVYNDLDVVNRVRSRAESVEKEARDRKRSRRSNRRDLNSTGDGKPKCFDDLLKVNDLEMQKNRKLRVQRRKGDKDGPPSVSMKNLPWPSVLESVKKCAKADGVDLDKPFRTPKLLDTVNTDTLQGIREKLKTNRKKSSNLSSASQTKPNSLLGRKPVLAVRPKVIPNVDVNCEVFHEEDKLECDSGRVRKTLKNANGQDRAKGKSRKERSATGFDKETAKKEGEGRLVESSRQRKAVADDCVPVPTDQEKICKRKISKKVSLDSVIVKQQPSDCNEGVASAVKSLNSPTPEKKQTRRKKQTVKDVKEEKPERHDGADACISHTVPSKEKRKKQRVKGKERGMQDEMPEPKYEQKAVDSAEHDCGTVVLKTGLSLNGPAPPCEKSNKSPKFVHRGRILDKQKREDFQQEFTSLIDGPIQKGSKKANELLEENLSDKTCANTESSKQGTGYMSDLEIFQGSNIRKNAVADKVSSVICRNLKNDFCTHQNDQINEGCGQTPSFDAANEAHNDNGSPDKKNVNDLVKKSTSLEEVLPDGTKSFDITGGVVIKELAEKAAKYQPGTVLGERIVSAKVKKMDAIPEHPTESEEMSEIALQFNKGEVKECVVKDESKTKHRGEELETAVTPGLDRLTKEIVEKDDLRKVDCVIDPPILIQEAVDEALEVLDKSTARGLRGEEVSAHKQSVIIRVKDDITTEFQNAVNSKTGKDNGDIAEIEESVLENSMSKDEDIDSQLEKALAVGLGEGGVGSVDGGGVAKDEDIDFQLERALAVGLGEGGVGSVDGGGVAKDEDIDFQLERALAVGLGEGGVGSVDGGGVVEEIQADLVNLEIAKSEDQNKLVDEATVGMGNTKDVPDESEKSVDEMFDEFRKIMFGGTKKAATQNEHTVVKMPQSVSNVKLSSDLREKQDSFSGMNKEETLIDTLESEVVSAGRQALETHSRLSKDCVKHLIGEKSEIPKTQLRRLPPIGAKSSFDNRESNDSLSQLDSHSESFSTGYLEPSFNTNREMTTKMGKIAMFNYVPLARNDSQHDCIARNENKGAAYLQSEKSAVAGESLSSSTPCDRADSMQKMIDILMADKKIMRRAKPSQVKDDNGLVTGRNGEQKSSLLDDGSRKPMSANSKTSAISPNKLGKAENESPINENDTTRFQEKDPVLDSSSTSSGVTSSGRTSTISNRAKSGSEDEGVQEKVRTKRREFEALSNKMIGSLNQKTDESPGKSDLEIEMEKLAKAAEIAKRGFIKPFGFSRRRMYAPEEVDPFGTVPSTYSHEPLPVKKLEHVQLHREHEEDSLYARKIKTAKEKTYRRLLRGGKAGNSQAGKKRNSEYSAVQSMTQPEDVAMWNEYIEPHQMDDEGYYYYQPYPEEPIPMSLGSGCMFDENAILDRTPSTIVQRPVAASRSLLPRRARQGEVPICRVPQPYGISVAGYMPCPPSTSHEPFPLEYTEHPGRQIAYPFYNPYSRF